LRLPLLAEQNSDVQAYLGWLDYIGKHGGLSALAENFSDYSPAYLFLLALASPLQAWLPAIWVVKLISIAFSFLLAYGVYRLVRVRFPGGWQAPGAALVVLFAPTVVLNSAWWGQTDAIYAALAVFSAAAAAEKKPAWAAGWFGAALAIKAQAIFLAPFLLVLWVKGELRFKHFLLVPVGYLIPLLPAFIAGRPVQELVGIYGGQAQIFQYLNMNAPNFYLFVPNRWYHGALWIGAGLTVAAALFIAGRAFLSLHPMKPDLLVLTAALCAASMPFLLPKMHDRYWFLADVLTIALAFYCPRLAWLAVLYQAVSLLSYGPYLFSLPATWLLPALLLNLSGILVLVKSYWSVWRLHGAEDL
jgi:Gpi18-like mannosyltransferase